MAAIIDTVRPGDIISSDLMNRIIRMLNDHDAALAGGGTGTGTGSGTGIITGFIPPSEQDVGKPLVILGSFDLPLDGNTVTVDGIPIAPASFLIGSSAQQIVFNIPSSISVPPATTKGVIIRVVNSKGTNERAYSLRPQASGVPAPTVSVAVDIGTNTLPLRSSSNARITGKNFAAPAATNKVRLILNAGTPTQKAFPPNAGDSLVIDEAQSAIQPAPADCTLVVMMPALTAAEIPVVGQQAAAALEITTPGGTLSIGFQIRRIA